MTETTARHVPGSSLPAWLRRIGPIALALALLAGIAAPVVAQDATPAATPGATAVAGTPVAVGSGILGLGDADISAAIAALLAVQADDGGFIGFSGESDPGVTVDAVLALVAAEEAGVETGTGIDDALDYLEVAGVAYAEVGAGQRAKLVLAVTAAGADETDFAGQDLWAPIEGGDTSPAVIGDGAFALALVTLAAVAVESERTGEFNDLLVSQQLEDGSWAFSADAAPGDGDSNTTALAIQAIIATGDVEDPAIAAGLAYLDTTRAEAGGYGFGPSLDGTPVVPDANSTAVVLQARLAALVPVDDPALVEDATVLAGFQNESGQFRYVDEMPEDNLFATVQAVPAIAGLPLPLAA